MISSGVLVFPKLANMDAMCGITCGSGIILLGVTLSESMTFNCGKSCWEGMSPSAYIQN